MTAAVIIGPWLDSETVSERALVRKWLELWPALEAMPIMDRVMLLQRHGFTAATLMAMGRILQRHRQDVLRQMASA
jgi:hypothetical protein